MGATGDAFACYPSLAGKAVFVTGGGSGIGASVVEHFCAQQARVTFVDIDGCVVFGVRQCRAQCTRTCSRPRRSPVRLRFVRLLMVDAPRHCWFELRRRCERGIRTRRHSRHGHTRALVTGQVSSPTTWSASTAGLEAARRAIAAIAMGG